MLVRVMGLLASTAAILYCLAFAQDPALLSDAVALHELGHFHQAERRYREHYLAIAEQHGPGSVEAAEAQEYLAAIYLSEYRLVEAEDAARHALGIMESRIGKDSPEAAWALAILGAILGEQGQLARATPVLHRAIFLLEKAPLRQDAAILAAETNLAIICQRQGDFAEARSLLGKVLSALPHDPRTEATLAQLAIAEGDWSMAESWIRAARQTVAQFPGPRHPLMAGILRIEAAVMKHANDFAGAAANLAQAIEILDKAIGPDSMVELGFLEEQVDLLRRLHRKNEVRLAQRRIRRIRRSSNSKTAYAFVGLHRSDTSIYTDFTIPFLPSCDSLGLLC
jgi:tetratricopeptide (TPR) repeat protein